MNIHEGGGLIAVDGTGLLEDAFLLLLVATINEDVSHKQAKKHSSPQSFLPLICYKLITD